MGKNYTIKDTTKVQREKYANDALSIAILDAPMPSEFAQECMREYVDGKRELSDAKQVVLKRYKAAKNA